MAGFGLNQTEQKFVEAFVKHGDRAAATKAAGVSRERGRQIIKEPRVMAAIEAKNREKLQSGAVVALGVLEELMVNSSSESVKLKAATDWLDRSGYRPEHNFRSADSRAGDENIEDLKERIRTLSRDLGLGFTEAEAETIDDQRSLAPTHPPDQGASAHGAEQGEPESSNEDRPEETEEPSIPSGLHPASRSRNPEA
jgi:phage terminase small subunit